MTHTPVQPHTYHVAGRTPGSGPVIAVLTDGPSDVDAAAHAAGLAAHTGTLLITAAAVATTGFSMNALLHHARTRSIRDDRRAITARVMPVLHSIGVAHFSTALHIPPGVDATRGTPLAAIHQLINRFGAVAVVTTTPLHDPTGALRPAEPHRFTPHPRTDRPTDAPFTLPRPRSFAPW
jgi:hypothetical protein